jgi:3-methyladenine DNA glycosylase Tag
MRNINEIYKIALARKGSDNKIFGNLNLKSDKELLKISDDRYLSEISKRVFQSGFYWRVIENKWEGFEKVFFKFNVSRINCISPDEYESILCDERIVRNKKKIESVIFNAELFEQLKNEFGSFAKFLISWPKDDQHGLYKYLNKNGNRFGITTTAYFLRSVGFDAYFLTRDVVKVLLREGVVSSNKPNYAPTSKKDLQAVQDAFNYWKSNSNFSYSQISKILVCSIDTDAQELI